MSIRWAHVTMMFDGNRIYELMEFCDGKVLAGTLDIRPVKHGGQDEQTGELKAKPTGREVILAYAQAHKVFSSLEAWHAAREQGLTRASIYTALSAATKAKQLKRDKQGNYSLAPVKTHGGQPYSRKGKRIKPEGTTIADKILAFVRSAQNGTGAGVMVADIEHALKRKGLNSTITKLVANNKLARIALGAYRVIE